MVPVDCRSWLGLLGTTEPLGATEEPVLGSLAYTEPREDRFPLWDICRSPVCRRRAENKMGTLEFTLAWGPKEKGQEGELWQVTMGWW